MTDENSFEKSPNNFEAVRAMIGEYGSAARIPIEALVEVGYVRLDDGSLQPADKELRVYKTLETKNEQKPFEPFMVEVQANSTIRELHGPLIDRFRQLEDKVFSVIGEKPAADVHFSFLPFQQLESDFETLRAMVTDEDEVQVTWAHTHDDAYIDPCGEWDGHMAWRIAVTDRLGSFCSRPLLTTDLLGAERSLLRDTQDEMFAPYLDPEGFLDPDEGAPWDEDTILGTTEMAVKLSEKIEQNRAYFTDLDKLYEIYDNCLHFHDKQSLVDVAVGLRDLMNSVGWDLHSERILNNAIMENYPTFAPVMTGLIVNLRSMQILSDGSYQDPVPLVDDIVAYAEELAVHDIHTFRDLQLSMVKDFIQANFRASTIDLDTLKQCTSSREIAEGLRTIQQKVIADAKTELNQAKRSLKANPFGSEGRSDAESQVSQAKANMSKVNQVFEPLFRLYERPLILAAKLNSLYDEMQGLLHTSADDAIQLMFVADIDRELDKNPGMVSGDCTENRPLPFLDPSNSLYNVKVMREQAHIGNVYLLQVKNKQSEPIIWHLDAIQIPIYTDWSAAARQIIDGFIEQAKQKGVKAITVNYEDELISNYNYIAKGIKALNQNEYAVDTKLSKLIRQAAPSLIDDPDDIDVMREESNMQFYQSNGVRRLY